MTVLVRGSAEAMAGEGGKRKGYFHFDGLGSTGALTDANENVTDSYAYSAFGEEVAVTNGSVNPFHFVGQWEYYDDGARGSQSGLWLLGVRYYDTARGRFLSRDPFPDPNRYNYVRSRPVQNIDPTGAIAIFGCNQQRREIITNVFERISECCKDPKCRRGMVECWQRCGESQPKTESDCFCKHANGLFGLNVYCGGPRCVNPLVLAYTEKGNILENFHIHLCESVWHQTHIL
jgi:RHS repeat-associated protein